MSASTLSAQIRPGTCIDFITDTHGTVVALADTCRQDTIYIDGGAYGGPWVFRAGTGVTLSVAPAADVLVHDTVITPAQVVIFEGDTVSVPADTTVVHRLVHGRDTIIITASSSAGGRTYMTDGRANIRPAGVIDSTTNGLYILNYGFGTLNYQGYANFSNNGAGGSDSTSFQINGLGLNGFIVPVESAYPIMFERFALKTSYASGNEITMHVWPDNVVASSDSSIFSVHIKTEFVGGVRYYYLRIYKLHKGSVNGLSVPHNTGTLVCSAAVPENRFPAYGTSAQIRINMWVRRL